MKIRVMVMIKVSVVSAVYSIIRDSVSIRIKIEVEASVSGLRLRR